MAALELKINVDAIEKLPDDMLRKYITVREKFESLFSRSQPGMKLMDEQLQLQNEYRDIMWKHPDWGLASDVFPTVTVD